MEADNQPDRRAELCERFRASLSKPVSEQYFEEDELIDLFDYAGDLSDDYLKIEVMLCGARLYPESALLKERRAIFYSTLDDDSMTKYLADNAAEDSLMWRIMRLCERAPHGDEARKAILDIIDTTTSLPDEETIQLVNVINDLGQYDLLWEKLPELRAKVEYLPALLFEIAAVSESQGQYEKAAKLMEELTDSNPYNDYYWTMIAQEYFNLEKYADAENAVDLALAINPENEAATLLKVRVALEQGGSPADSREKIEAIYHANPDNPSVVKMLTEINRLTDRGEENVEIYRTYLTKFPYDDGVAGDFLLYHGEEAAEELDRYYVCNDDRETDFWKAFVKFFIDRSAYMQAGMVLDCYHRHRGTPLTCEEMLETYFLLGRFSDVIEVFNRISTEDMPMQIANFYPNMISLIVSLLKTGDYDTAMHFSRGIKTFDMSVKGGLQNMLTHHGAMRIADQVKRLAQAGNAEKIAEYDPFGIWGEAGI